MALTALCEEFRKVENDSTLTEQEKWEKQTTDIGPKIREEQEKINEIFFELGEIGKFFVEPHRMNEVRSQINSIISKCEEALENKERILPETALEALNTIKLDYSNRLEELNVIASSSH